MFLVRIKINIVHMCNLLIIYIHNMAKNHFDYTLTYAGTEFSSPIHCGKSTNAFPFCPGAALRTYVPQTSLNRSKSPLRTSYQTGRILKLQHKMQSKIYKALGFFNFKLSCDSCVDNVSGPNIFSIYCTKRSFTLYVDKNV